MDDLEGQNDEALEGLSAKVKLLKDVSSVFSRSHAPQDKNELIGVVYEDHDWDWK